MQHNLQYDIGVAVQDNACRITLGDTVKYWRQTQFQILVIKAVHPDSFGLEHSSLRLRKFMIAR